MALIYAPLSRPSRPKGPRAKDRAKRRRAAMKDTGKIRAYVFARERDVCRCCRKRRAESMHEIVFRSQGGKISRKNSIAVCGDGVRGCHGFLQRHEIYVNFGAMVDAEAELLFQPATQAAADWVCVGLREVIASPLMVEMEA